MADEAAKREPFFGKNIVYGIIAVVAIFWGPSLIKQYLGYGTASTCSELIPDIVKISKDNGSGLMNVLVLDVVEVKEHSNKQGSLECSGLAILSNAQKQAIKFRQYQEYDKWWVTFEPV